MATIFRSPLITRIARAAASAALAAIIAQPVVNLNLTTLKSQDKFFGAAGQAPKYDYPNPRGPTYPVSLRTHTDPLKISLLVPFNQKDWPVPKGPQQGAHKGFVQGDLPIGQDKFFGALGQVPQHVLPNPRGPTHPHSGYTQATRQQLIGQDALPFRQGDWPNPRGQPPRQDHVRGYVTIPVTVVAAPFAQTEWPNPRGPTFRLPIHQMRLPAAEVVAEVVPSFGWYQATNEPVRQRPYVTHAGETRTIRRVEIAPVDWYQPTSVPVRPPVRLNPTVGGETRTIRRVTLTPANWMAIYPDLIWTKRPIHYLAPSLSWRPEPIVAATLPFRQRDWQNPRGAIRGLAVYTQQLRLPPEEEFPPHFGQHDWQNPIRSRPRQDFIRGTQIQLPVVVVADDPRRQSDWPVPRRVKANPEYTRASQIHLIGQDALPFRLLDWPLPPRGYPPLLRDFIAAAQVYLIGQGNFPFNQEDWPNPRGATPRLRPGFESHLDNIPPAVIVIPPTPKRRLLTVLKVGF